MHPFHYKISLRFRHPSIDPKKITEAMGIKPETMNEVGKPRKTPIGTPLPGLNSKTYWSANISGSKPRQSKRKDLCEFLDQIMSQLRPTKDFLQNFVESGGEISLFIGLFCPQNSGITIPWQLSARFASLRISLEFDYYPGDPWS
jgi:Domain of unknown function (DUF4279)